MLPPSQKTSIYIASIVLQITMQVHFFQQFTCRTPPPKVSLNGNYLEYATSYKYLGFCIHMS